MSVAASILQPELTMPGTWNRSDGVTFAVDDPSTLPETCYMTSYDRLRHHRAALLASFNVPMSLARPWFVNFNGYFGTHTCIDDHKKPTSCTLWLRCLAKLVRKSPLNLREAHLDDVGSDHDYVWYEMDFFSHWTASNHCRVLCIDTPNSFQRSLQTILQQSGSFNTADMCALVRCALAELVGVLDMSVWRLRDDVRELEKTRRDRRGNFDDTHEIARHSIQISEVLDVSVQSLEALYKYQSDMHDACQSDLTLNHRVQAAELTRFHIQAVQNLKLRSDANSQRLQNEINLAFYSVASAENRVVKSIAILTMFFLPATYVCGWDVSVKFWIYWAVTIPATVSIVMAYWGFSRTKLRGDLLERDLSEA